MLLARICGRIEAHPVVRDLERTMQTYVEEYGIGPWEIYEFNPDTVTELVQGEAPAAHAWRSPS